MSAETVLVGTPNPLVRRLFPGEPVSPGMPVDYTTSVDVPPDSLAAGILGLDGVRAVHFGADFIAVTGDGEAWPALGEAFVDLVVAWRGAGRPFLPSDADRVVDDGRQSGHCAAEGPDAAIIEAICDVLDTRVRPALAQDGGDAVLSGFVDGVAYIALRAACAGCPQASRTLTMGIRDMVRALVPDVIDVREYRVSR